MSTWTPATTPPSNDKKPPADFPADRTAFPPAGVKVCRSRCHLCCRRQQPSSRPLEYQVTDQTGQPSQEWPPTDCGSTGLYVCDELQKRGVASGHKTASGATNLVSLLQVGTVIQGTPFFNAWMEPDGLGFVDGNGSLSALQAAIRSGVAGGHETCITAVEDLSVTATGQVDPAKTVLRVRNSWSASWGDHGSFRLRASTLEMLGSYVDFKQITVAA